LEDNLLQIITTVITHSKQRLNFTFPENYLVWIPELQIFKILFGSSSQSNDQHSHKELKFMTGEVSLTNFKKYFVSGFFLGGVICLFFKYSKK